MDRRSFLKVGFAGLIGAMFPKLGAERLGIDMPIGDVLAKLAGGQQLNSGEIEQVRLWGNRAELQNAFIGGIQTGQADVNAMSVRAASGEFYIPPNNGSWFGIDYEEYPAATSFAQVIAPTTSTPITAWQQEIVTPQSVVVWHDSTAGEFKIAQNFEERDKSVLSVHGNINSASSAAYNAQVVMYWYTRSGDALKYLVPLDVRASISLAASVHVSCASFLQHFYLHELPSIGDVYFKILFYHDGAANVSIDPVVMFTRGL